MRVEAEPGFILHRRPFGESSTVLEVLTEHHGRLGLIARGNRQAKKGATREALEPGVCWALSFSGRGELPHLNRFESMGLAPRLAGERLLSLLYVNELVVAMLPRSDPHPRLFYSYGDLLEQLQSAPLPPLLRRFEHALLEELGYALDGQFDVAGETINSDAWYRVDPDAGFMLCTRLERGSYSGAAVLALKDPEKVRGAAARELRLLLRQLIEVRLNGRTLVSWQFLGEMAAIKAI